MNSNPYDATDTGPHFKDLTGVKVGRLTVLRYYGRKDRQRMWECVCECERGGVKILPSCKISGASKTLSCGCLQKEETSKASVTHGMSNHDLYGIWMAMIARCEGRGKFAEYYSDVGVCVGLRSNPSAIEVAIGERAAGMTIDRANNLGSYTCGACDECVEKGWPLNIRWATMAQQLRNTRRNVMIEIDGITRCAKDWCIAAGISTGTLRYRMRRGLSGRLLIAPPTTGGPKWIAASMKL